MKRFLCALAVGLALLALAQRGMSGPRVEADPNKLYPITPDVGQWVICAASYMGEDARELARQTIHQLRRRDNLPAYFYDYSEQERKDMENYLQGRKGRKVRIQDQCGVLIGGFKDEKSARDALNDVKRLKMPDLNLGPQKSAYDMTFDPATGRQLKISPFINAFVTRNPTVPRAQQTNADEYKFLKHINSNEEFNLLNNPHSWTLALKDYPGVSSIQAATSSSSLMDKLWGGNKPQDVLGASAATAHNLADTLRKMGFEAYVLHTRRTSYVTVGGFENKDDPKLEETRRKLEQVRDRTTQMARGNDTLQWYAPLFPMRIPKP
jgi:hypothetical protein